MFVPELVEVLVDVLIRQVTAKEDTVDLAVTVPQVRQSSVGLAFLDELVETL